MEQVIISQNRHWQSPYVGLYERDAFANLVSHLETRHIQVCYELNDRNRACEYNGLKKLPFKVDEKHLITYNQRGAHGQDGSSQDCAAEDIKVFSFWEYFAGM